MGVIEVEGLCKRYGRLVAVDHVSFSVEAGECFSLLGPNGAGKTTTVEVLEGIRPKTAGRVYVLGMDVEREARRIKRRIGVVPQSFEAFERLTVQENVELIASIYDSRLEAKRILERLGLWESRKRLYRDLSGGMQRRVAIAMALVNNPELVFLDEPTTGLDPEARRETWRVIEELKREGRTVLLTTHYLEEAQRLSDRSAIMVMGRIAAIGEPARLAAAHGGKTRIIIHRPSARTIDTLRELGLELSEMNGAACIKTSSREEVARIITTLYSAGVEEEIEIRQPSLEDAFLNLVGARITEEGELR